MSSRPEGVVYLIDGVGGWWISAKMMQLALTEAEVPHELRHFYWSHGFGRWHADLTDSAHMRQKSTELADLIMQMRAREPHRPVFIVAKSGGTAVALAALAQLPADSVERVVLLSTAVSPQYDLRPALTAVRTELVSFWSAKDRMVLGLGTTLFGTADGMMSSSAGLTGFQIPEPLGESDQQQYRKLRQVAWDAAMSKAYNFGFHWGTSMPQFVRQYVAPLLGGLPAASSDSES